MRIHTSFLKSVGLFARVLPKGSQEEKRFRGTGFIVSIPSEITSEVRHHVVVTARHVAEPLSLGDWVMRLPTKGGGFVDVRSGKNHQWWFHPGDKDTVDVAVSTFGIPQEADCGAVRVESFVTDEIIKDQVIGPGDETFTVGLFNKIIPLQRHTPIVRFGNVSLIPAPGERVPGVRISGSVCAAEVYLIESRSIGGLSGSPVFARSTIRATIPVERKGVIRPETCRFPGDSFLLGLAQGHWDILPEDKNEPDPRGRDAANPDAVNLGIAVVVPAKKIRDIIYSQELVDFRKSADQRFLESKGTTTPD